MSKPSAYPPIEPSNFDLVVMGTGLPASILASAASSSGKSVLHLDPNPFYGSHFSSLSLSDLTSFLSSSQLPLQGHPTLLFNPPDELALVPLPTRPLFSDLRISSYSPQLQAQSSKFLLDVSGPRALFCADQSIDLLIKSGASNYVEFKGIDASFILVSNGDRTKLWKVPDSRAAIFKDKGLNLMEKNQLMRFFKLVQNHLSAVTDANTGNNTKEEEEEGDKGANRLSQEDLETPFVDFLTKMKLPPKIKSIILYAIALADYDQEDKAVCKNVLKTKEGIERLALYQSSAGRFTNAPGALIYPIYGQGELPQAFCRRAAVKGCVYVLRMPVIALLMAKSDGNYKGIRLASGQDIYSNDLVLDPSFMIPSLSASPLKQLHEKLHFHDTTGAKGKVARGICIIGSSLKQDVSNLLVVCPPRSLHNEQVTSVRALQIGGNLAICPPDMFVLYLSALCDNIDEGKKLLRAAINALLSFPDSVNPESSQNEDLDAVKPTLLWSALYIQDLTMVQFGSICSTPMPDGNLHYRDLLDGARKMFQKMYPSEEFFPETATSENSDEDAGLSLDT